MAIPLPLQQLIDQLNSELDESEQETIEGLNLVREILSRFPNNALLIQFFAYFNNVLLFVDNYKTQTQNTAELLSVTDVTAEQIREAGEDLSSILGRVIETKIEVKGIINRRQRLQ